MATCSDCNGLLYILVTYDCSRCNGSGELTAYDYRGQERRTKCPDCDGGHVYIEEQCDTCQGTGIE